MSCPLCASDDIEIIEKLAVLDIKRLYRRVLGIEVGEVFKGIDEISYIHCGTCDLRYFSPLVAGGEALYRKLQNFDWYYQSNKQEFGFAEKFIGGDAHVLEIGAGKGAFAHKIRSKNYVGLDFSKDARRLAAESGVKVVGDSVHSYAGTHEQAYDVVCAFQVLEHVPDVSAFLRSAVACLKPGGRLILSVPSFDSFSRYVPNFELDMPPHHLSRWSDRALNYIGQLFPVAVEDIWHEPLQNVHKGMYCKAIAFYSLSTVFLKREFSILDSSILTRMIWLASGMLGRIVAPGIADEFVSPRGISVTIVCKKIGGLDARS